jgi:phosphomannomutase
MKLFGTAGIRGDVRDRVTTDLALRVGRAVGAHAREAGDRAFVVGRDGRTTGAGLAAAVEAGLTAAGASVERIGQVPTPALAYASRGRRGVMLTASHNPPTDNGIKLFVDGQEYGETAERAIEDRVAAEPGHADWDEWGTRSEAAPLPQRGRGAGDPAGAPGGWRAGGDAQRHRRRSLPRPGVEADRGDADGPPAVRR